MAPVAEDMRTLTENLLTSVRDRGDAIVNIKAEVEAFMQACGADRQSTIEELRSMAEQVRTDAAELRTQMADGQAARLDAFRETYDRVAGHVADIAAEAQGILSEARAKRKATAKDLRDMADQMRNEAVQHAKELADSDAARMADFREMHGRIAGRVVEIGAQTREMLSTSESDRTHAFQDLKGHMAERMAELTSEVRGIESDAQSMLKTFRGELESFRSDRQEACRIWQDFTEARAGAPTAQEIEARRAKTEAAAERERKAGEQRRAEEKAEKEAWKKMSEEEKVLKIIGESPDGVSASEMGQRAGVTAQQAGKMATQFAESAGAPVRKDDDTRRYYPTK